LRESGIDWLQRLKGDNAAISGMMSSDKKKGATQTA
jgi:hypothetical protein